MVFYTPTPAYYTDPGDLNASVTHAQADAMVAAAAAVWNVPTSQLALSQGGMLREHVSSANVYFDGTNMVFPADVQATNYRSVPIAIVYDTDGSVIDTLLGAGASEPAGCRQNAVVESVDSFDSGAATINHALLILNGRCVGANADQLLQMQYQLARKFGRVLGVGWSQLNDNVFTGATPANALQLQYWPLMHPIDVICGPYTYKCLPQPFTLRPDELSVLAEMYPITSDNVTAGKTVSRANAISMRGYIQFPTGQGMAGVNVVARRSLISGVLWEQAQVVSTLTGMRTQQVADNPVTGAAVGVNESSGGPGEGGEGMFWLMRIPMLPDGYMGLSVTTESVNPLYTGDYALAAYPGSAPTPSGETTGYTNGYMGQGFYGFTAVPARAASVCAPGADGTEAAPVAIDATGWWTGQLCDDAHVSWGSLTVAAGRTWALEVTALDESGAATTGKMHPLLGVWNASDATGTLPTIAATTAPFNGLAVGTTKLPMAASSGAQSLRFAIADDRGKGRPDYIYKARALYADHVAPTVVSGAGGQVTISGMGFRVGNRVTVNGVSAIVSSCTANTIVATLPSRVAAKMAVGMAADVAVVDASTGASTVMSRAVSYDATVAPDPVRKVTTSATARYLAAGAAVSWSFTVTATQDGVGVAGLPVNWTSGGSRITLTSATGVTDASGTATVSASTAGLSEASAASVQGCVWMTACAGVAVYGVAEQALTPRIVSGAGQSVRASAALQPVVLQVTDGAGHPVQAASMTVRQTVDAWEGPCAVGGRCAAAPVLAASTTSLATDANGMVTVTPLEVSGVASVVNIAVSTGTQGFVSLALTKSP